MDNFASLLPNIIALAQQAGAAILPYCNYPDEQLGIDTKENDTVVTAADHAANAVLVQGLEMLSTLPILTEECVLPSFTERQSWETYWLIDPLDGTRGFVDHRCSFTVNIALIQNNQVVMGVIYAPVESLLFYASRGEGSWQQHSNGATRRLHGRPLDLPSATVFQGCYGKTRYWQEKLAISLPEHEFRQVNSSIKFCLLAAGEGDFYPKRNAISEWDTAAGQCILQEAGGAIVDTHGKALQYNTKASILNPSFVAMADATAAEQLCTLLF